MSLALASRRVALLAPWNKNELWRRAKAVPSLDLRFAENKSLVDATTGQNLVTFTRASGGTYVDSQGVIRNAVTNLLLRSEEFDNASWAGITSNVTPTSNTTTAPNGTVTADTLDFTDASSYRFQTVSGLTAGTTYTFSVWLASATKSNIALRIAGTSTAGGGALLLNLTPTLTRYSLTVTLPSGNTAAWVGFENRTIAGGTGSTGTIIAWGAQLEQSSTVGEYIPTGATINSAPRFDHNPTTGESLGLLAEEARTNSIRNNTMVGAVAGTPGTLPTNWSTFTALTGLTREVVGVGTENGISYIDVRLSGTPSGSGVYLLNVESSSQVASSNGQSWTGSAYCKLQSGSLTGVTSLAVRTAALDGSFVELSVTAQAFTPTNAALGLQRIVASHTNTSASTVYEIVYFRITLSGAAIDFTLRIGMPQLEQGAFATSVIPTTGTAATRSADVASISGSNFSSWYRAAGGTSFAAYAFLSANPASGFPTVYGFTDGTSSNRIVPAYLNDSSNTIESFVGTGGATQAIFTGSPYTAPAEAKTAMTFAVNDFTASTNAGSVATDNSGSIPTVNVLNIGNQFGSFTMNGHIRRLTYWPQRLGNEVLQRITQ